MISLLVYILSKIGTLSASASTVCCPHFWFEEPEMPKEIIK